MIVLDMEAAQVGLERIGALQQQITESAGDPRAGADEIADILEAVVRYLSAVGYEKASLKETLVAPMWEWAMYTIAPRALREDDLEYRYLVDKVISLRSHLEDEVLTE